MSPLDNQVGHQLIFSLALLVGANQKQLLIAIKRNLFNLFISFSIRLISFKILSNFNKSNKMLIW